MNIKDLLAIVGDLEVNRRLLLEQLNSLQAQIAELAAEEEVADDAE